MEIIKDYPAVTYFKPEPQFVIDLQDDAVTLKAKDIFAVLDGVHKGDAIFREFTLGSVVSYSLQYNEDPIAAYELAKEKGHPLHWANQNAVTVSTMKIVKRQVPVLKLDQTIWFEGKLFRIVSTHNHNILLKEEL